MLRTRSVIVNSWDRDATKHPSATTFSIDLPEPLYNVQGASLVATSIPRMNNLTTGRGTSSFVLTYDGTSQTITIADGYYASYSSARSALSTAISAAFPTLAVTATDSAFEIDDGGANLEISVDTTDVRTSEWDLSYYLGFPRDAVTTGTGTLTTTPLSSWVLPYVCVKIDELGDEETTPQGRDIFALIHTSAIYTTENNARRISVYEYQPPIRALRKLNVSLVDRFGTVLSFTTDSRWYMQIDFLCTDARCW